MPWLTPASSVQRSCDLHKIEPQGDSPRLSGARNRGYRPSAQEYLHQLLEHLPPIRSCASPAYSIAFSRSSSDFTFELLAETLEWVKQWLGYPSHYLPVVATGLIPRIYRRAAFPHRATPKSLPL